jgi:hypothetical protein
MKKRTSTGLVGRISQPMVALCGGVVDDVTKTILVASMQSIRLLNKKKMVSWAEAPMKALNMMKMAMLRRKSISKRRKTLDAM